MKLGIFLLCLGGYLLGRVPWALIMVFGSYVAFPTSWLLGEGISLLLGGVPIYFGIRRIRRACQKQEPVEKQIERKRKQLTAFQKENCFGCRFADEEALKKPMGEIQWCTRPEPPEVDERYCYSRERNGMY